MFLNKIFILKTKTFRALFNMRIKNNNNLLLGNKVIFQYRTNQDKIYKIIIHNRVIKAVMK